MTAGLHRGRVLVGLMLTMALAAMDTTIVATAIPEVVGDLGGFALFSWVFSIYLLAQTVTIPVYGKLADLYGRKPVLIGGTLVFLAGSALSAASWNMISLIAFRGLQGLGAGSIQATVNTLAGDLYDVAERGRVQGWLSSVWGIAAITGPTLGGFFAEYASWRWIFLVNLPIGAAALFLIARDLHERVARRRHRIDYPGALLVLLAAGALIFGLLQGGTAWPWLSTPSLATFAVTVGLTGVAVAVERRAAEPVMPPWVWRRRVLVGANLAMLGLGLLVIGPSTFLPTYAQVVLGLGPITAGFLLATMSITWPLASAVADRLYLRIGFRDTALLGACLCLAAACGYSALPDAGPVWQPVAATLVLGAGLGLLSTSLVVGVQSTVGWHRRGVVTGASMFSRYLGQAVGAAVFGAIANAAVSARLHAAPAALRGRLPRSLDGVSQALAGHTGHPAGPAAAYLRHTISFATHQVFVALGGTAVAAVLVLLAVTPRRFPAAAGDDDRGSGTVPAGSVSTGGADAAR